MLRTLSIKVHQFVEHWREAGLRQALERGAYRVEEAVPAVKDLSALKPQKSDFPGADVRIVEIAFPADVPPASQYPLRSRHLRAGAFVERGYRGFAAIKEGRVVADIWGSFPDGPAHPHVACFGFDLRDDGVYLFDFHVQADERGKSISTPFLLHVLHTLKGRGFGHAYGYYAADNTPALWFHRMLGYEERAPVVLRRVLLSESCEPADPERAG